MTRVFTPTLAAAALLSLLQLAAPSSAQACHPPSCNEGQALAGTVPANAPALLWRPQTGWHDWKDKGDGVSLVRVVSGTEQSVPVTVAFDTDLGGYLVQPDSPLKPGSSYTLKGKNFCTGPSGSWSDNAWSVTAAATAPLPKSLGTLEVKNLGAATIQLGNAAGMCHTDVTAARVEVTLKPSAEIKPWLPLLAYQTYVDGEAYYATASIAYFHPPWQSWAGRGKDRLVSVCSQRNGSEIGHLPPGSYKVVLKATLPGTNTTLETPPVQVTLTCPSAPGSDAGPQNPAPDGGPASGVAERGGCTVSPNAPRCPPWPLLPLALLLTLRRRRTQQR